MYSICIRLALTFLFRIITPEAWGIKEIKKEQSYLEFSLLDYNRKVKWRMETNVFIVTHVVEVFAARKHGSKLKAPSDQKVTLAKARAAVTQLFW